MPKKGEKETELGRKEECVGGIHLYYSYSKATVCIFRKKITVRFRETDDS